MISIKELKDMKETLSDEVIDDPEDILNWFTEYGVELIEEVLERRRLKEQG